jgi:hypothetical protein
MNVGDMKDKAPTWLPKAIDALTKVCRGAYEELEDEESMPPCFGAISTDFNADDGFAWGLLRIPDNMDKYEAYGFFKQGLAALQENSERPILGGFSITEGWELEKDMETRTGREVLVINVETPDGWRATKLFTIDRSEGDVTLKDQTEVFNFHFPEEEGDGHMQGMFAQNPTSKQ